MAHLYAIIYPRPVFYNLVSDNVWSLRKERHNKPTIYGQVGKQMQIKHTTHQDSGEDGSRRLQELMLNISTW